MTRRTSALDPASPLATLASELRSLRDRMGGSAPSIDEVSESYGIPRSTLYAALRGTRLPTRKVVAALARAWDGDEAALLARRSEIEELAAQDRNRTGSSETLEETQGHDASANDSLLKAPVAIEEPMQVGVIPPLADRFRGRHNYLDELLSGEPAGHAVISGLGGVGKTQIAAAYVRSALDRVDLLLWITASDRESVIDSYARAALKLGCDETDDADAAARWFLAWLQRTERSWLIVLDDLTDPLIIRGWWPTGGRGRVVVTTRRTDAALLSKAQQRLTVSVFDPDTAIEYLRDKLEHDPVRLRGVEELAAALGYLPLALAQAAAYIIDRGETCAGYLGRLRDQKLRLNDLLPADAVADDYSKTVAATWTISISMANQLAPVGVAQGALEVGCALGASAIPLELFLTPPILKYVSSRRQEGDSCSEFTTTLDGEDRVQPPQTNERELRDALHTLSRFSLVDIDRDSDAEVVRVHQLVRRTTLERLSPKTVDFLALANADGLGHVWPDVEDNAHQSHVLRVHARFLVEHHPDVVWTPEPHPIIWLLGQSLGTWGLLDSAIGFWLETVGVSRRRFGSHAASTLAAQAELAHWRGQSGDLPGAIDVLLILLRDCQEALGVEHEDTLRVRHELALRRGQTGDMRAAVVDLEELTEVYCRIFGTAEPETLKVRANLAFWRGQLGDRQGAAAMLESVLEDTISVFGTYHPESLGVRHDLYTIYGEIGDVNRASNEFSKLLADYLRVLGGDHPATLGARANLAHWRRESGDTSGAIADLDELVLAHLRILGPDHPDTLDMRKERAVWRGRAGDPASAVEELTEILADHLRVLGEDRFETLDVRRAIVEFQSDMGDFSAALEELKIYRAGTIRVLGHQGSEDAEGAQVVSAIDNALALFGGLATKSSREGTASLSMSNQSAMLLAEAASTRPPAGELMDKFARLNELLRSGDADFDANPELMELLSEYLATVGPMHPAALAIRAVLARPRVGKGALTTERRSPKDVGSS